MINEKTFTKYDLVEEIGNREKMTAYKRAMGGG